MTSPNSTLPTDDRAEQDSRYNPGEQINQEKMAGYSSAGIDQAEAFANDPENSSEKVREAEEAAGATPGGFYEPSQGGKKQPFSLKGTLKKRGPLALIATFLVGGGGILSFLFTPALGLVNLKEVLVGDLNDQLSAYSLRSDTLLRTKIDQRSSGICTPLFKIRCQFSTMSQRQVERFRQAGFTIESGDTQTRPFGRERILRMTAPDGTVISNPQELQNLTRTPNGRSLVLRAFNPVYASFSDAVANKTFGRLGISKARWYDPAKGPQESARSVIEDGRSGASVVRKDPDGKNYVVDPDAQPPNNIVYADDERFNEVRDRAQQIAAPVDERLANDAPGKAVTGVLTGAIKGVGILGAVDAACSVYNVARAVGAAAKTARALQMAQFSMLYLNTADSILAGTATPEEVEFLGEKLAQVETTQQLIDETQTSQIEGTAEEVFNSVRPVDNPYLGKSGYDSAGYKVAAFNEAPVLTAREQQYTVGGGLTGTFSGVTDSIAQTIGAGSPENIRNTCGVVQSWWVRGIGLAVGVIAAVGTAGTSLLVSVGGSIAISAALPFLEAALVDILTGEVVGPDTAGIDAGNAVFAGAAHIQGQVAQSRGLKPLTEDGLQEYLALSKEVENEYIAAARIEAQDTPLDVMNQYSFLGSFTRTLYTPTVQFGNSFQSSLATIPKILSTSLASIVPNASAQTAFNPERFERCQDEAYDELGIKADVFCNVRYGLSQAELNLDPLAVLNFMIDGEHITKSGLPKSAAYKDFITYCAEREEGWGETGEEGTPDMQDKFTGAYCMQDTAQLSNFRVYTLDKSIVDAMDEEEATVATTQSEIVSPVSPTATITSRFGPRTPPCAGCSSWHKGLDIASSDRAIFSIMDGEVVSITGVNNVLSIRHEDGLVSTYWHMRRQDITVQPGETVTAGQRIATMGNAGQSTGVHLHIELDISNADDSDAYRQQYIINTGGFNVGQRVDPLDFFQKNGVEGF